MENVIGDLGSFALQNLSESINSKNLNEAVQNVQNIISAATLKFDPNTFLQRLDISNQIENFALDTSNQLTSGFGMATMAAAVSAPLIIKGAGKASQDPTNHMTLEPVHQVEESIPTPKAKPLPFVIS